MLPLPTKTGLNKITNCGGKMALITKLSINFINAKPNNAYILVTYILPTGTSQNNLFFRLENLELIEFLIPENLHKTLEKLEKLKSLSVWPDTSNQVS